MDGPAAGARPTVEWRQLPAEEVSPPITRTSPFLELKLEHPDLDPSGHADRFFPDAVPYELDGTPRVFYWRPALAPSSGDPADWDLTCATTHSLVGLDSLPAGDLPLVAEDGDGTTLVVDGTIGGETTTSRVASYATPDVTVERRSASRVVLAAAGADYSVAAGERRRIRLDEQAVEPIEEASEPTTVTPELVVRYPGRRELHHPAPGATYRLFPSFGLDVDEVPNPLAVPRTAGELDDAALATALGVDLSERPYPERVLWQAFAYAAFDPHADTTAALTQIETGAIVVRTGDARSERSGAEGFGGE